MSQCATIRPLSQENTLLFNNTNIPRNLFIVLVARFYIKHGVILLRVLFGKNVQIYLQYPFSKENVNSKIRCDLNR